MKKYKTWEMVKLLSENPDKVFKLEDGLRIYSYKGTISCTNASPIFMEVHIYDEWEEVLKYVTWQEAIEANSRNRRVMVITDRNLCPSYTTTFNCDALLRDPDGDAMTALAITTGTWYILD